MGPAFDRLHPELRRRFGISVAAGHACVGTGVMERVWRGAAVTRPVLALASRRNILLPETGYHIPFRIENYPYVDSFGRETVTFVCTFDFGGRSYRFDASMVYDGERGRLVDYLGSHQHIATDLFFSADWRGGLVIRSGAQRFLEGPISFRIPAVLTGAAVVSESYDEGSGRFRIAVAVVNPLLGPLFGYWGSFTTEYVDVAVHGVPANVKPRREEARS